MYHDGCIKLLLAQIFLFSKNICYQSHRLKSSRTVDFWIEKFQSRLGSQQCYDPSIAIVAPKFLIINQPSITLEHPLIELDIKAITKRILKSSVVPDARTKEMFAIVTGMGRGKTRCLLEIDRALRQSNRGVISVAITFNGFTSNIPKPFPSLRDNYVLAIISRIISNTYQISYDDAVRLSSNVMKPQVNDENFQDDDHKTIIRSLIRYIVLEQRKFRQICRFVLLVDEVLYFW